MAMNYTTLVGSKSTNGSLRSWVNYSLLDVDTVLDEAQALLYNLLRTREMRSRHVFAVDIGESSAALPSRFLDPIGRMYAPNVNMQFEHKEEEFVNDSRIYNTFASSAAADPFETTVDSSDIAFTITDHGFTQGSIITISDADAVGGLTPNGTFNITSITDDDTFVIDASSLGEATSSEVGGGLNVAYSCASLIKGSPLYWAIWDERIQFDCAFVQALTVTLQYYRSLPLLSATNETNFLTDRYPQLLRAACVTAAADFMKDDTEYQKGATRLTALVQAVNAENDMGWRGMDLSTETP